MNRKIIQKAIIYVLSLLLLTACHGQAQDVKSQKLRPHDFESKLNSVQNEILVDVRTSDEYSDGHLANSISIDFLEDDFKTKVSQLDKNKPVFLYCGTGRRSGNAAEELIEMGFKQVYDLDGGISAWEEAGKKIIK